MKNWIIVLALLVSQNAFAIYMSDGEFLYDGKNLMISRGTLEGTISSGIKDARKHGDFVMQGEKGGALQRAIKSGRLTQFAACSNDELTIKLYISENQYEQAIEIQHDGKTYFRPSNQRHNKSEFHIESIENFMNPLESMEGSSGIQSEVITLKCES